MAKKGLGRGLDLLIPKNTQNVTAKDADVHSSLDSAGSSTENINNKETQPLDTVSITEARDINDLYVPERSLDNNDPSERIVTLKLSKIEPNKEQSRKTFDETALEELAQSIKQYGVIQPVVVCRKDDYYEIIAGERRWRAAKKAGLSEIPVVIRDYEEKERAEVSLIENIQRENLNPIEEAAAYKQLIDEYDLTQEKLAERVSKSRTAIANTMRLLKLDEKVQQMVIDGKLSGGHARALLSLESASEQIKAANKVIENNLNVRQTEEMVKELTAPEPETTRKKPSKKKDNDKTYKEIESRMTEVLGTKVRVHKKEKGGGKIEINYFSEDDLDRIYTSINSIGS